MHKEEWMEMHYEDGSEKLTPTEYEINSMIKRILPKGFKWYKRYSITNFYKSGDFTVGTINKSIETIISDIMFTPMDMKAKHELILEMFKNAQRIINDIYNDIVCESTDYVYSFSIDDMLDIQYHPELVEALNKVKEEETEESVKNVYNTLDRLLKSKIYDNNLLAVTYRAGGVKTQQFLQCFGIRGFAANIYSRIYRKPVVSNYNLGYQSTYDMAADSVSAAVAMFYSNKAIQDSETFSKKIRSIATRVTDLCYEDCGSEDYVKVTIRKDGEYYGENVKSDLYDYRGKFYKESLDDIELKVIRGDEEHLKGKEIYMRMAFNCKCPPKKVCVYCLGLQGLHSHPTDILGLILLTTLTDIINQLVLSTKHHIASAINDKIVFKDPIAYQFLKIMDEKKYGKNLIGFVKGAKAKGKNGIGENSLLLVRVKEFYGLRDIGRDNINSITPAKVSSISRIWIDRNEEDRVLIEIEIRQNRRYAFFTRAFLKYIAIDKNYKISNDSEYVVIDLSKWDVNIPVFKIPEATFDYKVFGESVRKLVNGSAVSDMSKEQFFTELHDLISRKVSINASVLDMLTKVLMCRDPDNGDYRLPKYGEPYKLIKPDSIYLNGSLAMNMAMGDKGESFFSFSPYEIDKKFDTIYDPIFMPEILDGNY